MPAERPNFYRLLDLDPSVDDWPSIEGRLVEKQRAWSRDLSMGNPKARRRAESALALVPDIRSVLADPGSRCVEAEQARRSQQQERQQQSRELDDAVALLLAGGEPVSESQFAKLAKRFAGLHTEPEIHRRLAGAGVVVSGDPAGERPPQPARERLDEVTTRELRQNLDHLGIADLYAFLGLGPQSSARALADRACEVYRTNHRSGRTDAETSASNVLAGLASTLFRSDSGKAKYDDHRAEEAMEGLRPNLDLAGAGGYINAAQRDTLINLARQRKVDPRVALDYIERYAATHKWRIEKAGGSPKAEAPPLQLCGSCFALASPGAASCPDCGQPLRLACPRCGSLNATANAACERCGHHVGDAPLVMQLLGRGQQLAVSGDLAAALCCFDQALIYWPDWQPALEARRSCDQRRSAREAELTRIEDLVSRRHLAAARPELDRCIRAFGPAGLEDLSRRLREGIRLAESAFQQGERQRSQGNSQAAVDLYAEALAASADFEPARLALAACPPPAPTELRIMPRAAGLRLTWRAAPTRHTVTYRIMRLARSSPRHAADGECLAEIAATAYDDAAVPVGEAWFYAVFSVRGDVPCAVPAVGGPHLLTAEVADLEVIAGDGSAALSWTLPPGCSRVEVMRRTGWVPSGPGDGTAVLASASGARDMGLANGETYGYRVFALFANPLRAGGWVRSTGCTATVQPDAPPQPVMDLRAERRGRAVILRWTPVAGAAVEIRQAATLADHAPGLALPAARADRFGALVAGSPSREAQVTIETQGRLFFVPLSIRGATAVAGGAVEVTTLDPVTGLSAQRAGSSLLLTWDWPPGCDEALVAWSHDHYLHDPREPFGARQPVSLREYRHAAGWLLRHAEPRPHYFTVFAKAPGADLYAAPVRLFDSAGQALVISYRVVVKRALFSRAVADAWVELHSSCGGDPVLPGLVMIGKAPAVPLSPQDGEVIAEAAAVPLEGGRAVMKIPPRHWAGRPYVRLFFKDAAAAREIRLLPAAREQLRVA